MICCALCLNNGLSLSLAESDNLDAVKQQLTAEHTSAFCSLTLPLAPVGALIYAIEQLESWVTWVFALTTSDVAFGAEIPVRYGVQWSTLYLWMKEKTTIIFVMSNCMIVPVPEKSSH